MSSEYKTKVADSLEEFPGILNRYRPWLTLGVLGVGISHKLQNLLMSLKGNTELMRDDINRGELHPELLDDVEAAVERILFLAVGLQEAAQNQRLEIGSVNLYQSCKDALTYLNGRLHERISIHLEPNENVPLIHADPMLLILMLVELLSESQTVLPPVYLSQESKGALAIFIRMIFPSQPNLQGMFRDKQLVELNIQTRGFYPWPPLQAQGVEKDEFFTAHRSVKIAKSIVKFFGGEVKVPMMTDTGCSLSVYLPCSNKIVKA